MKQYNNTAFNVNDVNGGKITIISINGIDVNEDVLTSKIYSDVLSGTVFKIKAQANNGFSFEGYSNGITDVTAEIEVLKSNESESLLKCACVDEPASVISAFVLYSLS